MATTRGKGGGAHTRAPEDEISGVAAPEAAAPPAKRPRPRGAAAAPAPGAPRPTRTRAPGSGVEADAATAEGPKKRGRAKRETYAETAARRRKEREVDQLAADLRAFALARPAGWDHEDWLSFLSHLGERGHDVSDPDGIGARLEQERLAVVLGAVQGLGPKRVQALVERFHTLWSLAHAEPGEVAAVPGMTRPLAERLVAEMRSRAAS